MHDAAIAGRDRRRSTWPLTLIVVGGVAALVGAYLDWLWWPVYSGLMITLAAVGLLIVGGLVAIVPRRRIRRIGLAALAAAVGLLLGQNLGPSREPLIQQLGGTLTMRISSPASGLASGTADCTNVASETEFMVSGDPNIRLDTDRSFVSISIEKGSRWEALGNRPRSHGVRLLITLTPEAVSDKGPETIGMQATETSVVDATFTNAGGRLTFSGLEPVSGPDYTGASSDLAGTIEWTCGPPA